MILIWLTPRPCSELVDTWFWDYLWLRSIGIAP